MFDDDAVIVEDLHVALGGRRVLRGVTFSARRGRVTALLGVNGAGKTTTLRALGGLITPVGGDLLVFGSRYADLPDPARLVGFAPDQLLAFPGHTARQHLGMIAARAGASLAQVRRVLDHVGLSDRADSRVSGYSLGMRRRLSLAAAMLADPALLILDEPTNGLDPEGQSWLRDDVRARAERGAAVLVSSHALAALDGFADDVVILRDGVVPVRGSLRHLRRGMTRRIEVEAEDPASLQELLRREGGRVEEVRGRIHLVSGISASRLAHAALRERLVIVRLATVAPTLDELFRTAAQGLGDVDVVEQH